MGLSISRLSRLIGVTFLTAIAGSALGSEKGVSANEIIIGTVNAQSGPAANLGLELNEGAKALIERVNKSGGVHGRKIKWLKEDDTYEPNLTLAKTNKLIGEGAFALFNFVGTPTGKAALPSVDEANIPLLGLFTGAEVFRNPVNKNVFNVRASYWDETEAMVKQIVDVKKLKNIAVFMQDDAYGQAGQSGVAKALQKRGMTIAAEGKFQRNTANIDDALSTIAAAKPDAVVMVGTYQNCAAFVKKAKAKGMKTIFLNVSFVGTAGYISAGGADVDDTFITQVVPHPDSKIPVVEKYRTDLKEVKGKISYGSLEGYMNAITLVEALNAAGKDISREKFRSTLSSFSKDVGGFSLRFAPGQHQASQQVFLTKVVNGKAVEVTSLD